MPKLDPHRLFPAEPRLRALAADLYDGIRDLPIVSPHGHTDPVWFAEDAAFANPTALFVTPDHYVFRMLIRRVSRWRRWISLTGMAANRVGTRARSGRSLLTISISSAPRPRRCGSIIRWSMCSGSRRI